MAVQAIRGRMGFEDWAKLGEESHEFGNRLLGVALAAGEERHGLQPRARLREAIEHGVEHLDVAGLADQVLKKKRVACRDAGTLGEKGQFFKWG